MKKTFRYNPDEVGAVIVDMHQNFITRLAQNGPDASPQLIAKTLQDAYFQHMIGAFQAGYKQALKDYEIPTS